MTNQYHIITSQDGSHTIGLLDTSITFHSTRGALQESNHVFIDAGLKYYINKFPGRKKIKIFEAGFGTGLNALLTAVQASKLKVNIEYHAIDLYPLPEEIFSKLNYPQLLQEEELYKKIMTAEWNKIIDITPLFKLKKIKAGLQSYIFDEQFDIIFFDAFAPEDQAELWTEDVFQNIYNSLNEEGLLTTYCSKSVVQRRLQSVGFKNKKLKGPPGKREIIKAEKL